MFHILEYDHLKLDPESLGQFHDSDTYVIRWHLMISQAGQYHVFIMMMIMIIINNKNVQLHTRHTNYMYKFNGACTKAH